MFWWNQEEHHAANWFFCFLVNYSGCLKASLWEKETNTKPQQWDYQLEHDAHKESIKGVQLASSISWNLCHSSALKMFQSIFQSRDPYLSGWEIKLRARRGQQVSLSTDWWSESRKQFQIIYTESEGENITEKLKWFDKI